MRISAFVGMISGLSFKKMILVDQVICVLSFLSRHESLTAK